MRLKDGINTLDIDGTQFLVPAGAEDFRSIIRSNETAAVIVELLREETSAERIVDVMCAEYDAPEEQIRADVAKILETLRSIDALDE